MYCDGKGVPTNYARALDLFRRSSAQGESLGWFNLGWMYAKGLGVPKDAAQGYAHYRRSAEGGWPRGQFLTALCLLGGLGVQTNLDDGTDWLIKAASGGEDDAIKLLAEHASTLLRKTNVIEAAMQAVTRASASGSVQAAHFLGRMHMTGYLLPRDRARACEHLSRAATNGIPAAALQLGTMLFDPTIGVPQPAEAWSWIEYAAKHDDMQGIPMLASRYLTGDPAERNAATGTNWLWRGVQRSQAPSMTFLAELLLDGSLIPQDRAAALSLLKRSAELGHAPAQTLLASHAFATPPSLAVTDALRYFELAAEQQWPPALAALSQLYLDGKHVARDPARGRDYLMRASELNDPTAQYNLGIALLRGQFGETNMNQAAVLFRSCALQGFSSGQSAYGYLLSRGEGVPLDLVEAWKWFELAAAARDQLAQGSLDRLRKTLTPEQIGEARRRAQSFRPVNYRKQEYLSIPRPVPAAQAPPP